MTWDEYWQAHPRPALDLADRRVVRSFGDLEAEYRALRTGAAVVDRSFCTRIELTGADRLTWLHSFTTNQIKTLRSGDGNYGFALNGAGRIQFDVHALIRDERIWLVLDGRLVERAMSHLNKYIIMEDVRLRHEASDVVQIGIAGPRAAEWLAALGAEGAAAMALEQCASFSWSGERVEFFRSDFCGVRGYELFIPAARAVEFWQTATQKDAAGAVACGRDAVEVCRVESGVPDAVADLQGDVLPAETGQFERAVSFSKGCYLGQEIVERMRSRGSVARKLVGLKMNGDAVPAAGAQVLSSDGREAGRLTSCCHSPALNAPIGLAILKLAHTEPGTRVSVAAADGAREAEVCRLPLVDPN